MKRTLTTLLMIGCASASVVASVPLVTSAQNQTPVRTRQAYDARNPTTTNPNKKSCDCPYDINKAGNQCGKTSAFIQGGGAAPICYTPNDPALVRQWNQQTGQW